MLHADAPIDAGKMTSEFTIFPSLLREDAVYNSDDIFNIGWRGVALFVDATAEASTSTIDIKVQFKDPVSGEYFDLTGGALAQITAVGNYMLVIYPGIGDGDAGTDNLLVSAVLPRHWRVVATVGGTSFTFSIGACYLP